MRNCARTGEGSGEDDRWRSPLAFVAAAGQSTDSNRTRRELLLISSQP